MWECDKCDRVACLLESPSPCQLEEQRESLEWDAYFLKNEAARIEKLMEGDHQTNKKIEEWKKSLLRYRVVVSLNEVYSNLDGVTLTLYQIFPTEEKKGSMFYYFNPHRQSVGRYGGGQIILSRGVRWSDGVMEFSSKDWEDLCNGAIRDENLSEYLRGKVSEIIVEQGGSANEGT